MQVRTRYRAVNTLDCYIGLFLVHIPWNKYLGIGRSLLATSLFFTLLLNDPWTIFRPIMGIESYPICQGFAGRISLFCLLDLEIARYVALGVLFIVAIGFRPRYTGLLHWWVNYSFVSSCPLIDGGEQVLSVLTFLLLAITFTDARKWHWSTIHEVQEASYPRLFIANFTFLIVRVQVCLIYLHSAVAKCSVTEWINGTALYYWLNDNSFGLTSWLRPLVMPLLVNPFTLPLLTWAVLVLEFLLAAALFMNKTQQRYLLYGGIVFHGLIGLMHGLWSFALIMIGALVLYLHPRNHPRCKEGSETIRRQCPKRLNAEAGKARISDLCARWKLFVRITKSFRCRPRYLLPLQRQHL